MSDKRAPPADDEIPDRLKDVALQFALEVLRRPQERREGYYREVLGIHRGAALAQGLNADQADLIAQRMEAWARAYVALIDGGGAGGGGSA